MATPLLLDIANAETPASNPRGVRGPNTFFTVRPGEDTLFLSHDNVETRLHCDELKLIGLRSNRSDRNTNIKGNIHARIFFAGSLFVGDAEHPWTFDVHATNTQIDQFIAEGKVKTPAHVVDGVEVPEVLWTNQDKINMIISTQNWQAGHPQMSKLIDACGQVGQWERKANASYLWTFGPPAGDPNDRSDFGIPLQELEIRTNYSEPSGKDGFTDFKVNLDASYQRIQKAAKMVKENPEGFIIENQALRNGVKRSLTGAVSAGHPREAELQSVTFANTKFNIWGNSSAVGFNSAQAATASKPQVPLSQQMNESGGGVMQQQGF